MREEIEPGVVRGSYWEATPDGRIRCDLCPRHCTLSEGQRGFCFVREARGGAVVLTSYGRAIGVCVDPIEKKPLYHFFPGSSALSFGTAGCNLGCRFCQNWDMSKARDVHGLSQVASPAALVASARQQGCRSIAYTYNDPIVFAEYAIDCAELARAEGISNVAVSNGFILGQAREDLYGRMDAINVDLKSFEPEFYRKLCAAKLEPVLETLEWIAQKTDVWLEVTTLVIPGMNDSEAELQQLAAWIRDHLGPEVPLHLSAFHPAYKMMDTPRTPSSTLHRARRQALELGLRHVYTGNIDDPEGQSTSCAGCGRRLIERAGYEIRAWHLDAEGRCPDCLRSLAGRFEARPGTWGHRRRPLAL